MNKRKNVFKNLTVSLEKIFSASLKKKYSSYVPKYF